jgi:hypothetical protein
MEKLVERDELFQFKPTTFLVKEKPLSEARMLIQASILRAWEIEMNRIGQ